MAKTLEEKHDAKLDAIEADCAKRYEEVNEEYEKKIAKRDRKADKAARARALIFD